MGKPLSIAIDGPAGAGKSTTARAVAAELGYVYVDSGAMYRAVAWKTQELGIAPDDAQAVTDAAQNLDIRFAPPTDGTTVQRLIADGSDITDVIRSPVIAQGASTVSVIPAVRETLVAKQRSMGAEGGVVMEGRDIGTVVLPNAEVKIFLTASLDERARRRFSEMEEKGTAQGMTLEQVRADIAERDRRDSTRAVSPLTAAPDAVLIDSERMTMREVVDAILDLARLRMALQDTGD